ncbi:MAG: hypothetical protein ACRC7N_07425 [Clostridium sp.]
MGYTVKKNTEKYYKYRKKYNNYKSLCKSLEKDYNNAVTKVNLIESHVNRLKNAATMTSGEIHGRPIELFDDKCTRYYNTALSKGSDFKNIIAGLTNRLSVAKNKRDTYKAKMDYEEANPIIEEHKWWWEE